MGKSEEEMGKKCTKNGRWQKKLKELEAKERYYQQHRLLPEYKPRLTEPVYFWEIFFRQKDALERAILATEDVHAFALEPVVGSPSTGKRRFLVTSYPQMWHTIRCLYDNEKPGSYYEIITEGAVCKLYFDLEFMKQYNPDHDGEQMVAELIQIVSDKLQSAFDIHCDHKDVLVLDASTESKFSSHLIFNLRNAAFKDNINVGNFVRQLCSEIQESGCEEEGIGSKEGDIPCKKPKLDEETDESSRREQLFSVRNAEGKQTLFIDEGVYTKNRNFRLYKCVKLGKDNPLLVAEYGCYEPRKSRKERMSEEKRILMDSLITNIKCTPETRILTFADRLHHSRPSRVLSSDPCPGPTQHGPSTTEGYGSDKSPFPELDEFVISIIREGGVQGSVRQWVYYAESHTVLYEIFKNRWCGNIGRAHKSNNIKILVNLKRRTFYQKCHDPECKGYKSEERPLPADCLPFVDDYTDEELLEALDVVENNQNINDHSVNTETEILNENAKESDLNDVTDDELNRTYDSITGSML